MVSNKIIEKVTQFSCFFTLILHLESFRNLESLRGKNKKLLKSIQ